MCGVYAYAGQYKGEQNTSSMLACLAHRGPDHEGVIQEGDVTLGHRRLSIIDTHDRSHQPMQSRSGRTAIVYNGEIYNFQELKTSLEREGVSFQTQSDTEVILEGYERHGVPFFGRMRGMWAFVIHDRQRKMLVSARDPFGIKPLYYNVADGEIRFASELRCLLAAGTSPAPNTNAYPLFYNLGYFPAPDTPYKNTWKLSPGEIVEWDITAARIIRISRVSRSFERPDLSGYSYEVCLDYLEQTLTESVAAHYVSDVPVSLLLSGGNDSSLIAAFSRQIGKTPAAYHVAISGSEDTYYAERVARSLGLPLKTETLTDAALARQYEKVWHILDEPTADVSVIPTSLVYESIAENAKVVLSGEGGDELFGGYLRHRMLGRHSKVASRHFANTVLNACIWYHRYGIPVWNPFVQRVRERLLQYGMMDDVIGAYLKSVRVIDYPIADTAVRDALYRVYESERSDMRDIPPALVFDIISYLPNDLLYKTDIASMASSIEARVPLVDRHVFTAAAAVHDRFGGNVDGSKQPLKDVLRRYLPDELVFRDKQGFGVPLMSYSSKQFVSDFKAACDFHLEHHDAFAVSDSMAALIRTNSAREAIVRKYPRFAFALVSNWKLWHVS